MGAITAPYRCELFLNVGYSSAAEAIVERVGAPPVILRWPTTAKYSTGELTMDGTTLAAARIGRKFAEFFVNERGLLVYCRRVLIWCFTAVHDTLQGRTILNVQEDD
jgi:hypothetical protein